MSVHHREQTLEMAEVWEALAREAESTDTPKKQIAQGCARQNTQRN